MPESEKAERKALIKQGLEGLKGKIDGLVEIKVITELLPSSTGDLMLDSSFTSAEALKGYSVHPEHPTEPQGTERMSKIKLEVLIMLLARRNNNSDWLTNWFEDNFFDTDLMPRTSTSATAPATNIKENEKAYTMEVAAPGLKKEWVRINLDNDGNLCIAIENKMEHKNEDKHEHYLRREFSYSNYQQSYTLPEDADREKISAKVNDGVLTILIPKVAPKEEEKNVKNIEVK